MQQDDTPVFAPSGGDFLFFHAQGMPIKIRVDANSIQRFNSKSSCPVAHFCTETGAHAGYVYYSLVVPKEGDAFVRIGAEQLENFSSVDRVTEFTVYLGQMDEAGGLFLGNDVLLVERLWISNTPGMVSFDSHSPRVSPPLFLEDRAERTLSVALAYNQRMEQHEQCQRHLRELFETTPYYAPHLETLCPRESLLDTNIRNTFFRPRLIQQNWMTKIAEYPVVQAYHAKLARDLGEWVFNLRIHLEVIKRFHEEALLHVPHDTFAECFEAQGRLVLCILDKCLLAVELFPACALKPFDGFLTVRQVFVDDFTDIWFKALSARAEDAPLVSV